MLYFVATPIGNLNEMTYRAVEVLKEVDEIYAEDTRHSLILLNHYEIKKPLFSYQKWSEKERCGEIIDKLKDGKNIAVISDAGMPLISDPGNVLSIRLHEENIQYTVISGACACINALVLSGLSTQAFCMVGFLPPKNGDKIKLLEKYKELECTLIFYTPPHDVKKDLAALFEAFKERKVAVVREISKKFETVTCGILGSELEIVEKGEMVLVISGKEKAINKEDIDILEELKSRIDSGIDKKDAVKQVAKEFSIAKSEVYKVSLELNNKYIL